MSEIEREKIAANVVTYNRKQLLGECLDALLNQTYPLDAIYIIDNASTDGTPEYLMEKGLIDNILYPDKEPLEATKVIPLQPFPDKTVEIHYVRMHKNTGSSGGQYEGVKRGYGKGYDWLWLMDDDGLPNERCLEILLDFKVGNLALRAPLVIDRDCKGDKLSFILANKGCVINTRQEAEASATDGVILGEAKPFNGLLIHKSVISKIGLPKKEFFMWGDETEFLLRSKKAGFSFGTIVDANFKHPKNRMVPRRVDLLFLHFSAYHTGDPFRDFLIIRNGAYIALHYGGIMPFLKHMAKYFLFYLKQQGLKVAMHSASISWLGAIGDFSGRRIETK